MGKFTPFVKKFQNSLKGKSVFDIGFGFGQSLLYFRDKKNMKVSGIEPSIEGYEYVKSKGISSYNIGIEELQNYNFDKRTI